MKPKREEASSAGEICILSAPDLIPDDKLGIFDLIDHASEHNQDDPIHCKSNLYAGIYAAHAVLGFPVAALALIHRRARAAFIMTLSRGRLSFDAIHMLRRLLYEIPGGKRYAEAHEEAELLRAKAEIERGMWAYRAAEGRERARAARRLN